MMSMHQLRPNINHQAEMTGQTIDLDEFKKKKRPLRRKEKKKKKNKQGHEQ